MITERGTPRSQSRMPGMANTFLRQGALFRQSNANPQGSFLFCGSVEPTLGCGVPE
jgi:hypothetical protein